MSSDQSTVADQPQIQLFLGQALSSWSLFQQTGTREHLEAAIALQQASLDTCPHGYPDRALILHRLALFVYARYERWGNEGDLEKSIMLNRDALDLRPEGHADRYLSLANLANALRAQFKHDGRLEKLEEVIALERAAVELSPSASIDRSLLMDNLVASLWTRFEYQGGVEDLHEAIAIGRTSLKLRSEEQVIPPSTFANLANCLRTHFGHCGTLSDLEQAIALERTALKLLPNDHPQRPSLLGGLSNSLCMRFDHSGKTEDLEEAITSERAVLELRPEGHPLRSLSLGNLGNYLRTCFIHTGRTDDLDEAIRAHHGALKLRGTGHPDRSSSLDNLAICLWSRFECAGNTGDLEEAISLCRAALELRPHGHPLRSLSLGNLANCLRTHYVCFTRKEDLEESIALEREVLELRPEGHPHRSASLDNLASSLWTRFVHDGRMQDLEEAIILVRAAVDLRPDGQPLRALSLSNLANFVLTRFEIDDRMEDLEESIALSRSALKFQAEDAPNHSLYVVNLANAIWRRFERTRSIDDLEEAVSLNRTALGHRPDSHPLHYLSLGNLGCALSTRSEQIGCIEDLEEAIVLERQALNLRPEGNPHYSLFLDNLAISLLRSFQLRGNPEDLQEAIALKRTSLELKSEGHPSRSLSLINLAEFLYVRFQKEEQAGDLEESIQTLRRAATHTLSSSPRRLQAANRWVAVALSHDHPTLIEANRNAMSIIQRVLTIRPTLSARHKFLSSDDRHQVLALNAASHAISKGEITLAIEILEQGRALLWSQMRGLRTPLDHLSRIDKALAGRLKECNHRLESLMTSSESRMASLGPGAIESNEYNRSAERRSPDEILAQVRRLSEEQEEIIDDVRRIPGCENFLRPVPFEVLRQAASEGPVIVLNHSVYRCDALIVLAREVVHVPIDSDFYDNAIKLHDELIRTRLDSGEDSEQYDDILRRVMKALWDRVVSKIVDKFKELGIPDGSRIWWCPTSVLSAFPFHAAGPYQGTDSRMRYLLDDYISSYTPTLASLINARTGARNGGEDMLFIADTKLPFAKKEWESIIRIRRFKQLIGDRAAPDAVLRKLRKMQWVHFVCHGQLEGEPFNSSLKLPGGRLTLLDIARSNLPNAEFAFLSACHTAEQGPKFALDEALHLAAAIQFCGFRSVVGTMWKLLDRDGPYLSGNVYGYLMRDLEEGEFRFKRAAAAVRTASLRLRERGDEEPNGTRIDIMTERWVNLVHIGA